MLVLDVQVPIAGNLRLRSYSVMNADKSVFNAKNNELEACV
jgi:hypothetical protein